MRAWDTPTTGMGLRNTITWMPINHLLMLGLFLDDTRLGIGNPKSVFVSSSQSWENVLIVWRMRKTPTSYSDLSRLYGFGGVRIPHTIPQRIILPIVATM